MPKPEEKPSKPSEIDAKPSKPVEKPNKDKKDREKDKIKKARKFEPVQIEARGTITAGQWVAEMDTSTIRKNTLR